MRESERARFLELISKRLFLADGHKFLTGNDADDAEICASWWEAFRDHPLKRIERAIPLVGRRCRYRPKRVDLQRGLDELQSQTESALDAGSRQCSFTSGTRRCPLRGYYPRNEGDVGGAVLCEHHEKVRGSITAGIQVLDRVESERSEFGLDQRHVELATEWRKNLGPTWQDQVLDHFGQRVLEHVRRLPVTSNQGVAKTRPLSINHAAQSAVIMRGRNG